jgi:hypothetical protein
VYLDTPWNSSWASSLVGEVQVLQVLIFHKNVHGKIIGPFEFVKVPKIQKYPKEGFPVNGVIIQIKMIF